MGFSNIKVKPLILKVWQPDNNTTPPEGNWHYLGVDTFVPQWSVVESKSWWKESNFPQWEKLLI